MYNFELMGLSAGKYLLLALCAVTVASAKPVTWVLQGVTFSDGGTASGSFVYDADTNTYSSVNITTTTTGTYTGHTYATVVAGFSSATALLTVTTPSYTTGTPNFYLTFTSPLTDSGGTLTLSVGNNPTQDSAEAHCDDVTCNSVEAPFRLVVSGGSMSTVASAPALSAPLLALLGALLAGSGLWIVWRQVSAQA